MKDEFELADLQREAQKLAEEGCPNCEGENARTGHVELWDGVCPDCGKETKGVMNNGQ